MRTIDEYLAKAAEFADLAARTKEAGLKKRYGDLAQCYRLQAAERQRLIAQGTVRPDEEASSRPSGLLFVFGFSLLLLLGLLLH